LTAGCNNVAFFTEVAGKPKVAAVIMRIEDQIEKDGKDAWCALARNAYPPLTER
jgi:hypothetical protein